MTHSDAPSSPILRVVRQTGLYALGNVALKAGGLILAPFYLDRNLLLESAYGHLVLLDTSLQIGLLLLGLGTAHGLLKLIADPDYEKQKDHLPLTALVAVLGIVLVGGVFLWLLAPILAGFLLDDASFTLPILLLIGHIGFKTLSGIPYMVLRTNERAGLFAFAIALEMVVMVVGVYYFLAVRQLGITGILTAYILSSGCAAVVLVGSMLVRVPWKVEWKLITPMIRFGAPLAFAGLASRFLIAGDTYLLQWLTNAETVGVYGWAQRLSSVLNLLFIQSFQLSFTVVGLKTISRGKEGEELFRRMFRHYVIWTTWAVLGLSLLTYDVTALLSSNPHYLGADPLVFPVALGALAFGIYLLVVNVLYAEGKTHVMAILVTGSALFNALLNLILIPLMGAMGAALATVLSFALLAGTAVWTAERVRSIRYPWRVLGIVLILVLVLYAVGQLSTHWEMMYRLAFRFGLIALYPVCVYVFGLYTGQELRKGYQWIRSRH